MIVRALTLVGTLLAMVAVGVSFLPRADPVGTTWWPLGLVLLACAFLFTLWARQEWLLERRPTV